MDKPKRKNKCTYCGKEEVPPFYCHYCGLYYCSDHRLPEKHKCAKLPSRRRKARRLEPKKVREGECSYHLCDKPAKVECPHCHKFFCEEHAQPMPPHFPDFESSDVISRLEREKWREGRSHPCPPYYDYLKKKERERFEKEWKALDRLLATKSPERKEVTGVESEIPHQVPIISEPAKPFREEKPFRERRKSSRQFRLLNVTKYIGCSIFSLGCVMACIALLSGYLKSDWIPKSFKLETGFLLSGLGFILFFLAWILGKSTSGGEHLHVDKKIAKIMAGMLVLVLVSCFLVYPAPMIFKKLEEIWNPLPTNYYDVARETYGGTVSTHDIRSLYRVLMSEACRMPSYDFFTFNCSTASSRLEWVLEGHGFHTKLCISDRFSHTWVMVELEDGSWVAVESTLLTAGNYYPPGIIEGPNGRYREYSYLYQMYRDYLRQYGSGWYILPTSYEDFIQNYLVKPAYSPLEGLNYYSEGKSYESPAEAIRANYRGFDWWNVTPYNTMEPFRSWD